MTDILSRIAGPSAVGSGDTTVFTGLAGHIYTIRNITIVNPTVGTINFKIGINGVADANLILPSLGMEAGGWAEYTSLQVLAGVETLVIHTDGAGLTVTVSGLDQS